MKTSKGRRLVKLLTGVKPRTIGAKMSWTLPRVRGRFLDSGGVRIHFTDEGAGAPVVLVHGFAVNADLNWRYSGVLRALRRRFRVIAMDMRGHGLSGKPAGVEHYGTQMADDVVRLLDHLELDRAHLVGYSLGGFVALKLATTNARRLSSASVLGAGWEQPSQSAFLAGISRLAATLETHGSIGPISGELGKGHRRPSWRHVAWVRFVTKVFNDPRALAGVVRSTPELEVHEDELRGISIPVCSIVGERDPLLAGALALKGVVPQLTQVVVPRADHVQTPLRPLFRSSLIGFLNGV